MRIIAGKYKRRIINSKLSAGGKIQKNRLQAAENHLDSHRTLRPTSDRARESLFNILNNIADFDRMKCLDLFAGTGSVGFELLSRGAESVSFVDVSSNQIKLIEKTANDFNCSSQIKIYRQSAQAFLHENKDVFFDLIFADPPYNYEENEKWLQMLHNIKFNIFVFEYGSPNKADFEFEEYESTVRKIGLTNFKIFISES